MSVIRVRVTGGHGHVTMAALIGLAASTAGQ